MRKCFTRAFALVMAVLTLVSQMVFVSVAEEAVELLAECTCDPADRAGVLHDHVEPNCADYGYDLFICDVCGGKYVTLTDEPTGQHNTNIDKATCEEDMYCLECGEVLETLDHEWDVVVYPATCTEDGKTTETCLNCGEYKEYDIVPATGHSWVVDEEASKAHTCTENGVVVYACEKCDATYEEIDEAPGMHLYYDVEKFAPTCEAEGFNVYTCRECGYTFTRVVDSALGHAVEVIPEVPATCLEDGLTAGEFCTRCGVTLVEPETVPALGHTEGEEVTENVVLADCEVGGSYDVVTYCTVCGAELTRLTVVVDPTGHTAADPVEENRVEPTCEEDGSYDVVTYCEVCDKVLDKYTVTIPSPGHNWEVTEFAPTCTADGYILNECTECGASFTEAGEPRDPLSHDGELTGREEATCTEDGFTGSVVCKNCGRVLSRGVVIPATGHTSVYHDAKAATCTEFGWDAYETCEVCDYTTYVEIDALGHDHSVTIGEVEATCTEDGYTIWKCTRVNNGEVCGYDPTPEEYIVIPALGHTEVIDPAVAPTCTENGLSEGKHCSVCEYGIYPQKAIPALGHTEAVVEGKAPTCTENGYTEETYCTVCDEVLAPARAIPATGHVEGEPAIEDVVDATCTETGSYAEVVYCVVCEEILSENIIVTPALGHTAGRCVVENVVDATCTETGSYDEVTYCDVCFDVIDTVEVVVPAFGHSIIEVVTPATEAAVGYVDSYCEVCGEEFVRTYLDEEVFFTYEAFGINGEETAVNSGYVTVEVYANVVSDFARMTGVDIDLVYNEKLTFLPELSSGASLFENFVVKSYNDGVVKFTVDNGIVGTVVYPKTESPYLVATLVFKVAGDYKDVDATFSVGAECKASRSTALPNDLYVDYGTGVSIHVDALGDIDNDGSFSVVDTNAFIEYFTGAYFENPVENYDSVYDMDKSGIIDLEDLELIRLAIVHDYEYLTRG